MFLEQREVALNELHVVCTEVADMYRDAANLTDGDLAALFLQLAEQREQMSAILDKHLRALGTLPRDGDRDRETVQRILAGAKARLGDTPALQLLEQREQDEAKLATLIREALRADIPAPLLDDLQRMQEEILQTQRRLAAEKTSR